MEYIRGILMYIIGVTGYSGAGKTEFANTLLEQNNRIYTCELDKFWLEIVYENKQEMIEKFGSEVFNPDGSYNGKYRLTCDIESIKDFFDNAAPEIVERFFRLVEQLSDQYDIFIAEYVHLPQTSLWKLCNKRVLITSAEEERYFRLKSREHLPCDPLQAKVRDELAEHAWESIKTTNYSHIYNNYDDGFYTQAKNFSEDVQKDIIKQPHIYVSQALKEYKIPRKISILNKIS